jgi:tetratricopeptide (TPR) repeat protein
MTEETADSGGSASMPATTRRAPDLVLARLHLRLGSLALARAELETLAGRDELDIDGVVDLAEVRWRTGDVEGAGEAAAVALDDEEGPVVALVVASEAAAARGRPTEARRLATRAMAAADGSIDAIFAGMPRSSAFPPDPAAPPPSATTMFDEPRAGRPRGRHRAPRPESGLSGFAPSVTEVAPLTPSPDPASSIGLWDDSLASEAEEMAEVEADLPTGGEALELGRAALEAEDRATAALQLGLALRLTPALAPAVVGLLDDRHDPDLAFIRGDAYRLLGRELEARRAYADAVPRSPSTDPDRSDPDRSDPDPDRSDPDPDRSEGDPA